MADHPKPGHKTSHIPKGFKGPNNREGKPKFGDFLLKFLEPNRGKKGFKPKAASSTQPPKGPSRAKHIAKRAIKATKSAVGL